MVYMVVMKHIFIGNDNGWIYCGSQSCQNSVIYDSNLVICGATQACDDSIFNNIKHIYFLSYVDVKSINNNCQNVYFMPSNKIKSKNKAVVNCNYISYINNSSNHNNMTYSIVCATNSACESPTTVVNCASNVRCIIYCNEKIGIGCPNVIANGNITFV